MVTSTRKQEIKNQIEQAQQKFSRFVGHPVKLLFAKHATTAFLVSVEQAKVTELQNPPEKRLSDDGKQYTPAVLTLVFDGGGKIHFVLDSIDKMLEVTKSVIIVMKDGLRVEVRLDDC